MSFHTPDFFEFGGVSSADFGLYLCERPKLPVNKRSLTSYAIPGRNGSLHIDNGNFEDVEIPVRCKFEGAVDDAKSIATWLASDCGEPKQLRFSAFPGIFWEATIESCEPIEYQLFDFNRFDLTFLCKPQRFHDSGDEFFTAELFWPSGYRNNVSTTVFNPGNQTSMPIIRINIVPGETTKTVAVFVASSETEAAINFVDVSGYIELDTETGEAYNDSGSLNSKVSFNTTTTATPFSPLHLPPGQCRITIATFVDEILPVQSVEIKGRWWDA